MTPRQTVDSYFDALTSRDAARLIELITPSDAFQKIGTDAGEIVEGRTDAVEYYRHHVTSTEDFTIDVNRLDIHEREQTSWFFSEQTWRLKWQGEPETLQMRITGVLERVDDAWLFVQIHASIGL